MFNIFIEGNPATHIKKKEFKQEIQKGISRFRKERLIKGDVAVKMVFWLKEGKGNNDRKDLDNLIKTVLDALSGTIYEDDKQVVEIRAKKELNSFLEGVSIWVKWIKE